MKRITNHQEPLTVIDLTQDEDDDDIIPLGEHTLVKYDHNRKKSKQSENTTNGRVTTVSRAKGLDHISKRKTLAANGNTLTSITYRTPHGRSTIIHETFAKPRKMKAKPKREKKSSE